MIMVDFFEVSCGIWLNRCVVYYYDYQDDEVVDFNLVIELFNVDDLVVIKICNFLNIKIEDSLGGV